MVSQRCLSEISVVESSYHPLGGFETCEHVAMFEEPGERQEGSTPPSRTEVVISIQKSFKIKGGQQYYGLLMALKVART